MLAGRSRGVATLVLPLPNIAHNNQSFLVDPFAQFCALRHLASEGLDLIGIYHSHPGGGASPSEEDLEYGKRWQCLHLILALDEDTGYSQNLKAFRFMAHGLVREVEIMVVGM